MRGPGSSVLEEWLGRTTRRNSGVDELVLPMLTSRGLTSLTHPLISSTSTAGGGAARPRARTEQVEFRTPMAAFDNWTIDAKCLQKTPWVRVAAGGAGIVYRGQMGDKAVAIKQLMSTYIGIDEETLLEFSREVSALQVWGQRSV